MKHSCESVLESFVSRYENHFDSRRSTDEETSNEEFEIAVNGPQVLLIVMELYMRQWINTGRTSQRLARLLESGISTRSQFLRN